MGNDDIHRLGERWRVESGSASQNPLAAVSAPLPDAPRKCFGRLVGSSGSPPAFHPVSLAPRSALLPREPRYRCAHTPSSPPLTLST
jgi:hypothetical protein